MLLFQLLLHLLELVFQLINLVFRLLLMLAELFIGIFQLLLHFHIIFKQSLGVLAILQHHDVPLYQAQLVLTVLYSIL